MIQRIRAGLFIFFTSVALLFVLASVGRIAIKHVYFDPAIFPISPIFWIILLTLFLCAGCYWFIKAGKR